MTAIRPPTRVRDPRLDVFRGLTMFIIFVAHVPANSWNDWIPARFGFSSGSELFVFCSGAASAIAFGGVYLKRGWWLGTARILLRLWQVYWAHIGLFVILVAITAAADRLLPGHDFLADQFEPLIAQPQTALLSAATLTWLPDYIDILPMYLVILAMIPAVMAARRLHPLAPVALSAGLYATVWATGMNLPGDPIAGTGWFFNPFAWQAMFFTGFFVMLGWVPVPRLRDRRWTIAALAVVIAAVPVSFWGFTDHVEALAHLRAWLLGENEKIDLHILRWVHFLAVVYLVLSVIEPWRDRLGNGIGRILAAVGRQSLASFLASMVMARIAWVVLDTVGHTAPATALVNLAAFAGIIATAYSVAWFKAAPWAQPAPRPAEGGGLAETSRIRLRGAVTPNEASAN